jgi:hypothetical protein
MNMERLHLALAAFAGGVVSALLGWLESGESFNRRKFGGSAVRALIAAAVFAVGYDMGGSVGALDLLYAFMGGAGVDVIGNRISSRLGNGSFPLPPENKET